MIQTDVIIVGGGPAGSSCALALKEYGISSIILDKSEFPRVKLCAGWITPKVFSILELENYPYGILEFDKIFAYYYSRKNKEYKFTFHTRQFSIRRYEFDYWLLQISGAKFYKHKVQNVEEKDGYFIIDNQFKGKYLIGAGGTHCPVYKKFFMNRIPREKEYQIGALEIEFPYNYTDPNCYLWFFEERLPGYSWYVPKSNGYLNIGLGAFSHFLNGKPLKYYFDNFINKLIRLNLISDFKEEAKGHTYYLKSKIKNPTYGNVAVIGDSAGVATLDLGEGIGPAIESGIQCANWIIHKRKMNYGKLESFSIGWKGKLICYFFKIHRVIF